MDTKLESGRSRKFEFESWLNVLYHELPDTPIFLEHCNALYTNPKSQRNSELLCKICTSRTCIHLNVSINIMPSYLSIASNISSNHQCIELEEITNFVEVGCL